MSNVVYSNEGRVTLEALQVASNYNGQIAEVLEKHLLIKERTTDFGAGIGTFAKILRDSYKRSVLCVEVDPDQREILRKSGFEVYSSLNELGTSNSIYSLNVIEHIEDDKKAIAELVDHLAERGRLLVFVPAFQLLYSDFDKLVGHYRRYDRQMLCNLFDQGRVKIIESRYFDSAGFFVALIFKILRRKSGFPTNREIMLYDRFVNPLSIIGDLFFSRFFGKNVWIVVEKIK